MSGDWALLVQIHLSATSPPPKANFFCETGCNAPPPPKIEVFLDIFQKTIKILFEGDNLAFFSVDNVN